MPAMWRPGMDTDELSDLGDLLAQTARPPWHADAACREHPEISWFPEKGQPAAPAQKVCAGCLVRSECLAWALDQGPELQGVWGGLSPNARAASRGTAAA